MSCENYTPEVHNASDSEDSDYEVQSLSSASEAGEKEDCGQCWDCSKNDKCPAKLSEEQEEKAKKIGEKVDKMIKEEVNKNFKVPDRIGMEAFQELVKDPNYKNLTEEEKINKVAIAFWRTGGIDVSNILELKMLCVLIGATEQLEGFKNFPRQAVYQLLDMIIYHANKHMESLDI